MKEAIVHPLPNLTTTIHDVPIPVPAPEEVVVKVVVAGSNVKDWLHITAMNISVNSGDDIAGYVHALGTKVAGSGEFRIGDRVAAFHPMLTPGGAYAEYAVAPANTTFIIPEGTTFEEAATIPLVSLTAAISLFRRQGLPPPWAPRTGSEPLPLIVYGASSALGAFAIKLAKAANVHPIIAIGSGGNTYIPTLLDTKRGDAYIDYRQGIDGMKEDVAAALKGAPAKHGLDAISGKGTWIPVSQMLDIHGSQLSVVSGANKYAEPEIPAGVEIKYTYVGTGHYGAYKEGMVKQPSNKEEVRADIAFAFIFYRYLAKMLAEGEFTGHPYEVLLGGLGGLAEGLNRLKAGKVRGVKLVLRPAETEGI